MTGMNGSNRAVLYARVSSKDQEREGFSIPAQLKLLRQYAREQHLTIVREFIDVETTKQSGRGGFREMIAALKKRVRPRRAIGGSARRRRGQDSTS